MKLTPENQLKQAELRNSIETSKQKVVPEKKIVDTGAVKKRRRETLTEKVD